MLLMQKIKPLMTAFLIALPGMALAQDSVPLRPDDVQRLKNLNNSAGEALRAAFAGGQAGDLAILTDALAGNPKSPETAKKLISGEWECRVIKLGKNLPVVVYQKFACQVSDDGDLKKITGSQRTEGKLHIHDGQLIYLGTGYVQGDTPVPYEELPAEISAQDDPQLMPEVGVVEMVNKDKGRILFPDPYLESRADILVLTR